MNLKGANRMPLISAIYEGTIRHRRFRPVPNSFEYRLFFMYIDLAELPHLFSVNRWWSVDQANLAYFRRADYLGDRQKPLDTEVRALVKNRTGRNPQGPIRLLTHLRYFGYCFNPVSFYYCFDEHDQNVETIVAEINNTPWLERHQYVLDETRNQHFDNQWKRYQLGKEFHISPFMNMQIAYDWRFRQPGETINIHLNNFNNNQKLFDATLRLQRREITQRNLSRVLIQYPLMTAKVTAMIYWQALRLKVKGVPFYSHPGAKAAPSKGE
jgi:DUF1365 family protein